jgi:amino acid transporter
LSAGAAPTRRLSAADVAVFVLGIVVGVGIFRAPAEVAANTASDAQFIALWLVGAVAALAGALSYAEMAARHPGIGGEYGFLRRAWGEPVGVLFVWARTAVIQTGSIAAVAFVLGDYAARLLPDLSPAMIAGFAVLAFTLLNLLGVDIARRTQWLLLALVLLAILGVMAAGGLAEPLPPATGTASSAGGLGLALVFVMLTFGGWNEAAYLSGETRDGTRGFLRGLIGGILLITLIYLGVNLAYLAVLGRDGLAQSAAPAADLAAAAFGPGGEALITTAIILAALSTLNVTILTGARAMCALGQDIPAFRFLGSWDSARSAPRPALAVQGGVALLLILYGAGARDSFGAMVAFGAPAFWLFLLLTVLAIFRMRTREPGHQGFRVPLWPLPPLLFAAVAAWMLWSSIGYARFLAATAEGATFAGWLGMGVLAAGVPLMWLARARGTTWPAE